MTTDLKKTIVITGASDGIGAEAARQLKALGHNVVIVGRTPAKVEKIANELNAPFHIADFAKLADIARLAKELETYPQIDVLANNAGAMLNQRKLTEDGIESTFQVNVLGEFLLTNLLLPKLCQCHTTVIQTSSLASKMFGRKLDLADLQNENNYTAVKAYGEAKLCNILFTRELHRRFGDKGICAVALEPGIPRTNFAAEGPAFYRVMYHSFFKYLFTTSQKNSAKRLVRLALGQANKDFVCGETYSYKKKFNCKFKDDGHIQRQLWEQCEQMVAKFLEK